MSFKKFKIINPKDNSNFATASEEEQTMIINLDHIVSVKPIRINRPDKLIDGYWIRTSNGKKYRATIIPPELEMIIAEPFQTSTKMVRIDDMAIQ